MSKFLILRNRFDFLALGICTLIVFIIFQGQLSSYLSHDEVPPYYQVAYSFYLAGPLQFLNILMHPSATFGHPFIFPMLLGLLMKIFGVGSFIGKIYIFIFSSFSLYGFFQLSNLLTKNKFLAAQFSISVILTANYYINFPLLIGDTALLTLTIFYLYHLFKRHTKIVIYLAFIIGLTRESFLIYTLSLLVAEYIFQRIEKKKDPFIYKAVLWSPLSVVLWYLYNLLAEKKFIHSYASFNTNDSSYFDFSFNYAIPNAINKFQDIFISDPFIGISFLMTILSLFYFKDLKDSHKRLIIYAFCINGGTFLLLSFYHVFLDRYLLYSSYLFVLNFLLFLQHKVKKEYLLHTFFALPFLSYLFYMPSFSDPHYGKNVNASYELTVQSLQEIYEQNELASPIVACFPQNNFVLNPMGIYPRHGFNIPYYDKFNIPKIDAPYLYLICDPPLKSKATYKQFFQNNDKELLKEYTKDNQKLQVWKVYL